MAEINRRLKIGDDIVYPITKAENIIKLQKTIKDIAPLPTISVVAPTVFIEGQAWFDTTENSFAIDAGEKLSFALSYNTEELSFGDNKESEPLSFGKEEK